MTREEIEKMAIEYGRNLKRHPMSAGELRKDLVEFAIQVVKNCSIPDVSGSALLSKARQMRVEQQKKIDSYTEHYNQYEIGTLNGIDRILKLIERHYR